MASRRAALAVRASSGVAVGLDCCARSSAATATRCSSTSVGTRAPTFSGGRPSLRYDGSRCASASAISSCARRLGGWRLSSSVTGTDSAAASCSISDSLGSRRPFSSSESTDGARPTPLPELGERQPAGPAQVPQPLAERCKVYTIGLYQIPLIFHREAEHNLSIWKESTNFTSVPPYPSPVWPDTLRRGREISI